MDSFNIYSRYSHSVNYQDINKKQFLLEDQPVFCIVPTDSFTSEEINTFQKILSVQEKEKAARFRLEKDRISYIVTHARLRQILGHFLEYEPIKIEFGSNEYGKPLLSDKYKNIYFNLSHSSGLSVIGFDSKSPIGVDVEKIDPEFDFEPIVKTHFTQDENDFIYKDPKESRLRFYTLWTRKEAFLKAIGTGIGEDLGVEVLSGSHHFKPGSPISGIRCNDFYLESYVFQKNYLITTADSYRDSFIGMIDLQNRFFQYL